MQKVTSDTVRGATKVPETCRYNNQTPDGRASNKNTWHGKCAENLVGTPEAKETTFEAYALVRGQWKMDLK
jgi:hypothetical protein